MSNASPPGASLPAKAAISAASPPSKAVDSPVKGAGSSFPRRIPAAAGARAQTNLAAARAAHQAAADAVKANAARLQALITPDAIAATRDPLLVAIMKAKLAKATADAATIDQRLAANLAALSNMAAQIDRRTVVAKGAMSPASSAATASAPAQGPKS